MSQYAILRVMSDNRMLQTLIDGQTAIRKDIKRVEKKVGENGQRIDTLGSQLAALEDDAPTIEEFDDLKKRVDKYHPETKGL